MTDTPTPQAGAPKGLPTGRLRVLKRILPAYIDDLADLGATDMERETSRILGALHTALLLERTAELAKVARQWQNGQFGGMLAALPQDDQEREDAVAGLRLPEQYTGIG